MKSFCLRASCFCLLIVFVIYVIIFPKESLKSYDLKSEATEITNTAGKQKLLMTKTELSSETSIPTSTLIKNLIKCKNKDDSFALVQNGRFWMLKNYVKASKYFECHETITYTTHCDFSFLDNVGPLVERWMAPISIAIYAPGDDFESTKTTILFLRNCHPLSQLIQKFVTFHVFFESQFIPGRLHLNFNESENEYFCPANDQIHKFSHEKTFKATHNLTYPVNVGRNLAREAALTHFVLASDIELYPSPGLVYDFFEMIKRNPDVVLNGNNVFVIPIFEVAKDQHVPDFKSELQSLFNANLSVWFHYKICPTCHTIPSAVDWINAPDEDDMKIFVTSKRVGLFSHWEPIFIGTNKEPFYDERLNWEGKSDKMTQAYIMCLLDYNFNVLSNAFLVHKPGIKEVKDAARVEQEKVNSEIIDKEIMPEIKIFYGEKSGCQMRDESHFTSFFSGFG